MFTRQLGCGSARAAVLGGGRSRTGSPRGCTAAPCEAAGSGEERDGRSSATRPVLVVEDESDKWGPPDSESICGAQLSESRERGMSRVGKTFHTTKLTGRQRVLSVWHATCAKVVKL